MSPVAKRRQLVVRTGTRCLPISSALRERRKLQPFVDPDIGKHRDREYGIVAPYDCHSAARDHTWRYLPDKIINRYGRHVDPTLRPAVKAFMTGKPAPKRKEPRIIKPKWNIERPRNWWHKSIEENPFIPTCADWYSSPTGVAGNTGAVGSPWNLRKGLTGGGGSIVAGDTLYLRAGTYFGGFTSSFSGTALNPFKIKPYSSGGVTEQYTIEQYIVGTLTSNINDTTNDIGFTPAGGYSRDDFTSGDEFVINATGGPGVAESCRCLSTGFTGGPGNLTSLRALNGTGVVNATQGYAHTAGALIYSSNNGITVTGDHQQWWGSHQTDQPWLISRVQCSNPIRAFYPDISGNGTGPVWQRCRAAFTASGITGLEVIGLCLKDSNDGIFIAGAGGDHNVSAILAYNNGHVDEVRGHGQPCYIHTETGATFTDVISFSNFGSGSKFFASSGVVRNCTATRVHSFNNMAPSSYTGNGITVDVMPSNKYVEGNWFMGAYDTMEDCAMYDSVAWMPYDSIEKFPNVQFGFGGVCDGFVIDNNWFLGGDQGLHMTNLSNLTFTRNLMAQNTTGASAPNVQSNSNFHLDDSSAHFATWTWGTGGNINAFWDKNRLIGSDSHSYPFICSKDGTAGTNEFGSTGFQRYDVPADSRDFLGYTGFVLDYHEGSLPTGNAQGLMFRSTPCTDIPTRSHIPVWKCAGTSIGTFDLPAAELTACGLVAGDSAIIVNALDYFAGIAGGANKITLTNWNGSSAASIAAGSFTRENPIGFTTEDWRGNTWTLGYGELIVFKTASGGAQPDPTVQKESGLRGARRRAAKVDPQGITALNFPVVSQDPIFHREVAPMCLARRQRPRVEPQGVSALSIPAAPPPPSNEILMGQVLT